MNLEQIKNEMKDFQKGYSFLENETEPHVFALMSATYYYFDGVITKPQYENIFVDGSYDGGFDLIFNNEQSDDNDLIMFQSKFTDKLDKDGILNVFLKMDRSFVELKKGQSQKFNDKTRSAFQNCSDDKGESANDYLVLATIYNPKEKIRSEIESLIQQNKDLRKYKVLIYYGDDIEAQIASIKTPSDYIKEDQIKYLNQQGIIKYKDKDGKYSGAVVNISAYALKNLYSKHKSNNGLFNKNLRFFIRQKSVDDGIVETLKSSINEFWFKNNGIIIGCEDYTLDGDRIKLYNFSIINGAQTTSLIGESEYVDETSDFPIVCKLIKYTTDDFLNKVAEASNSQKPINERDLKANKPEQRNLQSSLLKYKPPIFMEIKRGEKRPSKTKYPESWRRTKNEIIGQLLLAISFQRPGTARSGKKTIFSVKSTYEMLFMRKHDIDTLADMLRLKDVYENYLNEDHDLEENLAGIAKNGTYCILALIGFFIKLKRGKIDTETVKLIIKKDPKEIEDKIQHDDLSGKLILQSDDWESSVKELIYLLLKSVANKYGVEVENKRTTSYANFLKTDRTYQTIILPSILQDYQNRRSYKEDINKALDGFVYFPDSNRS